MEYSINTAELNDFIPKLVTGDRIYLSGTVFTARDAAHKKIVKQLDNNISAPFDINDAVIYYAGPTPTPENLAIGSCGPTTSSRMDKYAPLLLDLGLKAMIGKGPRSIEVCEAIKRNSAIYLCAVGGAGALASKSIVDSQVIAFDELGCESIKKLIFKDFPLIVAIDSMGGNLFNIGE